MLIQLTQEHIDNGVPGLCRRCPYALAILAVCRPGVTVEVRDWITIYGNGAKRTKLKFLSAEWRRIERFDHGLGMTPREFEIEQLPTWAMEAA